jgi:hypothetical protein
MRMVAETVSSLAYSRVRDGFIAPNIRPVVLAIPMDESTYCEGYFVKVLVLIYYLPTVLVAD